MVAQHPAEDWQGHPANAFHTLRGVVFCNPPQLGWTNPGEVVPNLCTSFEEYKQTTLCSQYSLSTSLPHTFVRGGRQQTCR